MTMNEQNEHEKSFVTSGPEQEVALARLFSFGKTPYLPMALVDTKNVVALS